MGKTERGSDRSRHTQHSLILVPMDAPGVTVTRDLTKFGYYEPPGRPNNYY